MTHRKWHVQARALCALAVLLLLTAPAQASWIVREFLDTGSPPSNAVGGGDLETIFNVAADWWEAAIVDPGYTLTLTYDWTPLASVKANHILLTQGGTPHRETSAKVNFDNDESFVWYLDPTPWNDDEFIGYQESTLDLGGGPINVERRFTGATGAALGAFDLLQTALHEIGHALGMSGANLAYHAAVNDGFIEIEAGLPFAGTSLPVSGAHFSDALAETLMWGGGLPANSRRYFSEADILAMVQISQFDNFNLNPVPEPSTFVLLAVGTLGFLWVAKRSRDAA